MKSIGRSPKMELSRSISLSLVFRACIRFWMSRWAAGLWVNARWDLIATLGRTITEVRFSLLPKKDWSPPTPQKSPKRKNFVLNVCISISKWPYLFSMLFIALWRSDEKNVLTLRCPVWSVPVISMPDFTMRTVKNQTKIIITYIDRVKFAT